MNVGQLIEELRKLPQHVPVLAVLDSIIMPVENGEAMNLTKAVFDAIPAGGSITAPQICRALAKKGIIRDVRSITGILLHLRRGGHAKPVKRRASDDAKVLNRWERGTPYVEKKYVRIVAPTFDQNQKATVTLLLQHWG